MKYFASNHALTIQYLQTTVQTLRHDEQSLQDAFVQVRSSLSLGCVRALRLFSYCGRAMAGGGLRREEAQGDLRGSLRLEEGGRYSQHSYV